MRTLVIIPTYLEAENIADVLGQVRDNVPDADLLVVDDASPDGTADLARAAGEELGRVDVIVRPGKEGLGGAYRTGFKHAFTHGYEVVVQMDADLSHPPDRLPALLAEVDRGADIAIGSRYVKGGATANWPLVRQLLSRVGNFYASTVLGLGVRDATAGFRAYRADILETVEASATKATGYGFQLELSYRAHRLGATIVEVPITFNDRIRGVSKMSWHIIGEAMSLVTWWGLRDRVLRRRGTPTGLPARTAPPDPVESLGGEPPGSAAARPAAQPALEPAASPAGEHADAATAAPSAASTEPAQ
ncbi:MAG TPA: polyprenol monophosphomannose synthase [Acidimicrobiales bacterium]|nr:polyprenol monophosphomannose synthase [Acidimicrobiales bacterium]